MSVRLRLTGGRILFVGTKKQAKDVIAEEAARESGMPYINNRWMGGLLTNFETVRKSLDKLRKIEKMAEDGVMENLKKKEMASLNKEKEKLLRDLGGIREMSQICRKALFVIDSKREEIAIKEAARLKMPVMALIDTNCDPDPIQYPIPGNDDALKVDPLYYSAVITEAILAGQNEFREAQAVRAKAAEAATAQARKILAPEAKPAETAADPQAVTDKPEQPVEETKRE